MWKIPVTDSVTATTPAIRRVRCARSDLLRITTMAAATSRTGIMMPGAPTQTLTA